MVRSDVPLRLMRTSIAALLGGTLLAISAPAFADSNSATAQALFVDGRKLMEQKRYGEACPKFAASQKADPAIGTILNLGDCYEKNGELVRAWQTFYAAASFAQRIGRKDRQQTAQERAAALEPRLIKLTIFARDDGVEVTVDGGAAAIGTPLPVDPGKHTVEATAKGKKTFTTTIDVSDKSKAPRVDIPLLENEGATRTAPPPPPSPPPPTEPQPKPTVEPSSWGAQKTIAVVVAGIGVVGLGVGTFYGLLAQSRWNDAKGECNIDAKPPQCSDEGVQLAAQAKSTATISSIAFLAGGVFVAGGAVLFLTAPRAKTNATAVVVGPNSVLLRGSF